MQRADVPNGWAARAARVGCVVMASGAGRRFGSQKLLAPLAGASVLERTLASIPADVIDAIVVTRSAAIADLCERLGVACVRHERTMKSDTIRCGLDVVGDCAACMFLPGDQPLVSEESMRALVREARAHPASIVRLAWHGTGASPQVFPAYLFDELRALPGNKGGAFLLEARPSLRETVRCVEARHEWEIWDIDTPDDLARLEDALVWQMSQSPFRGDD